MFTSLVEEEIQLVHIWLVGIGYAEKLQQGEYCPEKHEYSLPKECSLDVVGGTVDGGLDVRQRSELLRVDGCEECRLATQQSMEGIHISCEPSITRFQEVQFATLVVQLGLLYEMGVRLVHCTGAKHAVEALRFEDETL